MLFSLCSCGQQNPSADNSDSQLITVGGEEGEEPEVQEAVEEVPEVVESVEFATNKELVTDLFDIYTTDAFGFFAALEPYIDVVQTKYSVGKDDWRYTMSVSDAQDLMMNSVGTNDLSSLMAMDSSQYCYADASNVYFCTPDSGEYWSEKAVITDMVTNENGDIEVTGYKTEGIGSESTQRTYMITLTPNPNSIWSGACATTANSNSDNSEHYYLPDVQVRVYSIDELYNFSEEDYKRARNEIFARHGRRFKTPELQAYFDQQSWYNGVVDEVPMEELNDFERANIAVLDEFKNLNGY